MNRRLKEGLRKIIPRSLVRHRILGGPLRGSVIVTSWHDYPAAILGRTEKALLECFSKHVRRGETWLDIGAHYGYTAIALCKLVGPDGRVYAFEPALNTAGCISRTRSLNNLEQLTIVPMALGNRTDLTIDSLHSVRGMIDSTLEGSSGLMETYFTSRFDWLWPRLSGSDLRIDGVKIDVQGMEIQVLEGMYEMVKQFRPKLLVEFHKGVSRPKLLNLIGSMGYPPRGLPIEPLPAESVPIYADNRTYFFNSPSAEQTEAGMVNLFDPCWASEALDSDPSI
jgi:FkbM family methyltransferase